MNKTRPVRPRQGDTVKASHMVNHAQAIEELQNQVSASGKKQKLEFRYKHPFKIYVQKVGSEIRLSVNYGRQYRNWVKSRNSSPATGYDATQENDISFETSQVLRNHPDGTAAGYTTLSVSTNYGIWARASYVLAESSTNFFGTGNGNGRGYMATDTYALYVTTVEKDDTNTEPDAYEGTGEAHLYIGKVTVDANGAWTIKQYWKSDIVCPCFVMPKVLVSADAGNSLASGSDGLIFVPPIVSGDTPNDITTGTDGGALYDAP